MAEDALLFPQASLGDPVVAALRRLNPWWERKPMPVVPKSRRHLVAQIRRRLDLGLAPIIVVRGPRQIGKTTAHLQLIGDLLEETVEPSRILHVQFDELSVTHLPEPILTIAAWFERHVLGKTLNEAAHEGKSAFLFLDEVQNLPDWAPQLKFLADSSTVKVFVTGSSALRIEQGRDSLAGRITTLESGVLSLTEIGALRGLATPAPYLPDNGMEPLTKADFWIGLRDYGEKHGAFRQRAFAAFSERGGYPLVHKQAEAPWSLLADQLNETVIRRVIQHDLRVGERGRKRDAALLEELFRLACRYAGQAPSVETLVREVQRALGGNVGPQRVTAYLRFLADTLLLRLVQPLEIRLKKKKGSPKLCLVDHGLRASWLQEQIPLDPDELRVRPDLTTVAGHLAESVVGSVLGSINGLDLNHAPARRGDPEVDFVVTIGAVRIPIEVKYQARIDQLRDTEGLRAFIEKTANNAPFGILITQTEAATAVDPRLISLPLASLMLLR
jgi:predicted AAA+ superfamily ATPase